MIKITDELLIETYIKAIEFNVDHDFILLLMEEINRRVSEVSLKINNDLYKSEVSIFE